MPLLAGGARPYGSSSFLSGRLEGIQRRKGGERGREGERERGRTVEINVSTEHGKDKPTHTIIHTPHNI